MSTHYTKAGKAMEYYWAVYDCLYLWNYNIWQNAPEKSLLGGVLLNRHPLYMSH